jgi:hypothetical protein
MAKGGRILAACQNFNILFPKKDEQAPADSAGKIEVKVEKTNAAADQFLATISPIGSGMAGNPVILKQDPLSLAIFKNHVPVGSPLPSTMPPQSNKNLFITVFDVNGVEIEVCGHPFKCAAGGSGSSGSAGFGPAILRCQNCKADQLLPVALTLKLGGPLAAGAQALLHQPTLLVHSKQASYACSWFSQRIDLSPTAHAVWELRKSDPKTWTLVLRTDSAELATYQLVTKSDRDCSFPIQLQLVGATGKQYKNWPQTATVSPGP